MSKKEFDVSDLFQLLNETYPNGKPRMKFELFLEEIVSRMEEFNNPSNEELGDIIKNIKAVYSKEKNSTLYYKENQRMFTKHWDEFYRWCNKNKIWLKAF